MDYVLIDRMNYHYGDWVYRRYELEATVSEDIFSRASKELALAFENTAEIAECPFDDALCNSEAFGSLATFFNETPTLCGGVTNRPIGQLSTCLNRYYWMDY